MSLQNMLFCKCTCCRRPAGRLAVLQISRRGCHAETVAGAILLEQQEQLEASTEQARRFLWPLDCQLRLQAGDCRESSLFSSSYMRYYTL